MAYFRKITLLLTIILHASCVQEEEYTTLTGFLQCPNIEVSHEVDDMLNTRASVELPNVPTDVEAKTSFVITDALDRTHTRTGTGWNLELPVGNYTINATYGSNTFGAPHFTATHSGKISASTPQTPSFSLSLANSLIRVIVADDLKEHFTPTKIKLSDGTTTKEEAYNKAGHYVPSGASITITLKGTNSVGNAAEYEYSPGISTTAGKASCVTCQKDATNWPTITIPGQQEGAWAGRLYITNGAQITGNIPATNITYEASSDNWATKFTSTKVGEYHVIDGLTNGVEYSVRGKIGAIYSNEEKVTVVTPTSSTAIRHTNDANGYLNGTEVVLALNIPSGLLTTLKNDGTLVVNSSFSDGSYTYRTASGDGTMEVSDGWPYIPQGTSYNLTVNHKLKDESSSQSFTKSGISVPAPAFTVTLGASYSSYDKYAATNGITKNITDANKCDKETIYNVGASWGIAAALMSNSHYTKSVKIYLDNTEKGSQTPTTNSYTLGNIAGITAWQAHTVKASVTFDGKTVEATKTHHITGLPYSATPPSDQGEHPWTEDQENWGVEYFNWNSNDIEYYVDNATGSYLRIGTPVFHLPSEIPINIIVGAHGRYTTGWFGTKNDVTCRVYSDESTTADFTAAHNEGNYKDYTINTLSLKQTPAKLQLENRHLTGSYRLYINKVIIYYR